jgi:hypothetical protein
MPPILNQVCCHRLLRPLIDVLSRIDSDETDNDDEDEESESLVDEDDNAPIRPGEDIPPLETVRARRFDSFRLIKKINIYHCVEIPTYF